MASRFQTGPSGQLIDPASGRVAGFADKAGNEALLPFILAQSAVPIILLPAGTWNNTTGQLAVGSPLPYLPSGVVWVYLFASGIAQAGLYQATFTGSAASPVAQIVGNPATVAGAYASGTAQVNLATVTVPSGAMGANGALRASIDWGYSNSANNKTIGTLFGGQTIFASTRGASASDAHLYVLRNRGTQNIQGFQFAVDPAAGNSNAYRQLTVNTAVDQTFTFTGQLANTTDCIFLEGFTLEVLPGA